MFTTKEKLFGGQNTISTKKRTGVRAKALKAMMLLAMGSVFSLPLAGSALAGPAKVKSKSLSIDAVYQHNTVRVISLGHEKFDAIEDGGNIKLRVRGHVDLKGTGRVMVGGFLLGWCGGAPNCSQFTVRYIDSSSMEKKKWSFDHELNIPTDLISHSGPGGIAPYPDGDRLIQACNNAMNGQGPVTAVTLDNNLTVSASAHTHKWRPFDGFFAVGNWNETHYGGDVGMSNTFPIKVECVPSEELLSQPISVTNHVVDTASGDVGACPRRVEHGTSIYYRRPTTATFKIKQNGNVVETVERSTETQTLSDGTKQYVIHYGTELMSPEGNNTYRVKVVGGPQSDAVQLNVNCSAFDITFANLSHTAPDNGTCPRQVWQVASFITNGPGSFTYELKHKLFGVFYEKEIEAQLFDGIYKAVDTRVIQLIEGETEFLAQVKGADGINSGWQSINIECEAGVNPGLPGEIDELTVDRQDPGVEFPNSPAKVNPVVEGKTGGLVAPLNPTHANPKPASKAPLIVDPKPAPKKAKPTKPKTKTAPVRVNPKPKKKKLICVGGKARGGKCSCGKNKTLKKAGKHKFQCIAVAKPLKKKKEVRTNPTPKKKKKAVRTNSVGKKKKSKLICKGGKIRSKKCSCPKGLKRKKKGKNKFLCFRPAG
ncbi:MAG: hypothetical protein AB8B94_02170 [Hyphomicrobiales bacterium]